MRNIYDNSEFFAAYAEMGRSKDGLKAASKFGIIQSLEQLPVPLVLCHQNFTTSGSCVNDENVAVAFLK